MLYRTTGLLLAAFIFLMACTSAPDTRPDGIEINPAMSPLEALDAAGPWIPESTSFVVVLSGAELWRQLNSTLLGLEEDEEESGAPGLSALERDLRELTRARLGMDIYEIDTFVLAFDFEEITVMAFKAGDAFSFHLPKAEGRDDVYTLSYTQWTTGEMSTEVPELHGIRAPHLYVYPLPTARPGVLMSLSGQLKEASWFGSSAFLQSEAGGAIRDSFARIDQEKTLAVMAGSNPDVPSLEGEDSFDVDSILLALGDEVTVEMQGEEHQLEALQNHLEEALQVAREEIAEAYGNRHHREALGALSLIYSYHMTESIFSYLAPQRSENRLRYQFPTEKITQAVSLAALLVPYFLGTIFYDDPYLYEEDEEGSVEILVTRKPLWAGEELDLGSVSVEIVPEESAPADAVRMEDLIVYIGRDLARNVPEGEIVLRSFFESNEDRESSD